MKKTKPTYAGNIKNSGNQVVKAPFNTTSSGGNTKVVKKTQTKTEK